MAQHLSIRIPWKDNGYNGLVCDKPCYNNSCLRLRNIFENRDDEREEELKGCPIAGHEDEIPCLTEGGAFMSEATYTKTHIHPYKQFYEETHGHFQETDLVFPPYSLPSRPYAWLLKGKDEEDILRLAKTLNVDYDSAREPELQQKKKVWIQDAVNQRAVFTTFYENVTPNESLVIPYAKQAPFIDDAKRVVMGLGLVKSVTEPPEHNRSEGGTLRSILWETMIGHSIRDDRKEGFLLPYREMMEYAESNPEFDIRSVTVLVEEEFFREFSYASEHLSYDAVISVSLQTLKALKIISELIPGDWRKCANWTAARLNEVWLDRGAFPGLGAMLRAVGFDYGLVMANEIKKADRQGTSYEDFVAKALENPTSHFSPKIAESVKDPERKAFAALPKERQDLFWLLARLSLSLDQADVLFNKEKRELNRISLTDREILENPYLLYERSTMCSDNLKIAVRKVDMAVFPPKILRNDYPLSAPSALDSENDERRIRAIAISVLEQQALIGHTVYPQNKLITDINELPIDPGCRVTGDILNSVEVFLAPELVPIECADGTKAYQLKRLNEFDEVIKRAVDRRLNANRHVIAEDWGALIEKAFGSDNDDEWEKRAREEKTATIRELAEARISVLVGGAGTGKTTLLSLLCSSPRINDGGVLLLAPTGKARVRMSQAMQRQGINLNALTVAQFLLQNRRFDYRTMRYKLSNYDAQNVPFTAIIDESSMLTEEMFGALIQTLRTAGRIIFVGDPNQLPPIGAGRPFVDLVQYLKNDLPPLFPRVGKSYGELTVTRRQKNEDNATRDDTALAEWFTNTSDDLDLDIFARLQGNKCGKNITFKTWSTSEELQELILQTVAEEVEMENVDDINGFNVSLGGVINNFTYFNKGCAVNIDNWQILAPVRNMPHGILNINRIIHTKYRNNFIEIALNGYHKLIGKPLGAEGIIYGDKVINVRNKERDAFPDNDEALHYVANGEIGIVKGSFGKNKKFLNVEFSSQPSHTYSFTASDFGEETDAVLELAYALTVHKAQGSEFGKVFLVISEPCGLLSKELLYTAITRHKDRLVILYNAKAYQLKNYSSKSFSDIARRFTCLFAKPQIIEFEKRYYEASLIHKTLKGDLVRSKSEVIVANTLYNEKIPYVYEKELSLGEDGSRIPDFTIDDPESGTIFYWEHCGMISDDLYRKRWEEKKALYAKHGIVEGDNLIVSYDDPRGGIDSIEIKNLIDKYFR
ncbi:MAG: AAA family ATPase [Deltaproteobacteria bacterium]|jgi:ATP-dependent exoDNAse (exonuclease V) alpha subunit|nr:AAA family ATPase [Deltaproteobacteria bacterium]